MLKRNHLVSLLAFLGIVFIYFLTSAGNTPYDYFTRLAQAFLSGRWWLTENPSWLSELIPVDGSKFYVVYPPMPAILLLPFVVVFGKDFPQQYLAHLVGAGTVVLTVILSWQIKRDKILALWSGALVGFGSIIWFLASVGSAWYLGQITAAFFLTAALLEGLTRKRSWLVGILLGAAFLSRTHTILSLPLFLLLLKERFKDSSHILQFGLPLAFFVGFDAIYNYIRFGTPWNQGYFLIPGTTSEPWFAKGIFHPSYIIEDLKVAFLALPKLLPNPPYIKPSWAGMAIWITTPAFVFALKSKFKEGVVKLSWLSILLIFLVVGMHGGTGFAQFGYRFAADFYPFLIFLTIKGVSLTGLRWYHWALLVWGILVNLWGVVWINKFGWVTW